MATVILLRHARSTANGSGVLAGRGEGVGLDESGTKQAAGLVHRLSGVPLAEIVASPLLRCQQTVAALASEHHVSVTTEPDLSEVDYGEWTGRELRSLMKEPLWSVVQQHPSAAVFPAGEGLAGVQARSVAAIRAHDARISAAHGGHAVWLACSHGDVIKSVLADALCQHLDSFQRIVVDPCSMSVVRYTETRPFVLRVNDTGGELASVVPPEPKKDDEKAGSDSSDAVVGGSTGAP